MTLCRIEFQKEIQVEHDLRIESHTGRVRNGKPLGLTRLGTASIPATGSGSGPADNMFFTKSIETYHRRLRKRDKANNKT
jgi:hypothetical protein